MGFLDILKPKKKVYPTELDKKSFWPSIENSDKPVLVDVFSPTCGPCQKMGPTITKVATDRAGKLNVAAFDISGPGHNRIAQKLKVRGVPTLLVFNKGKVVERHTGLAGYNAVISMVDRYISS